MLPYLSKYEVSYYVQHVKMDEFFKSTLVINVGRFSVEMEQYICRSIHLSIRASAAQAGGRRVFGAAVEINVVGGRPGLVAAQHRFITVIDAVWIHFECAKSRDLLVSKYGLNLAFFFHSCI